MGDIKAEWFARRVGFKQAWTLTYRVDVDVGEDWNTPPLAPASLLMPPDLVNGVEPAVGFNASWTYYSAALVRSQIRWCSSSAFAWNSAFPLGNSTGIRAYTQMTGTRQMWWFPTLYAIEFNHGNVSGLMNYYEGTITLWAVVR